MSTARARHHPRTPLVSLAVLGLLALAACGDTVVYGERTGVNLLISVDASRSLPVEVNTGLRRSLVASVPPIGGTVEENGAQRPNGEAVNLFSGFDLAYEPGTASVFGGDLTIRTHFASGAAATALAGKPEVVNQIVQVRAVRLDPGDLSERKKAIANGLDDLSGDALLRFARECRMPAAGGTAAEALANAQTCLQKAQDSQAVAKLEMLLDTVSGS